MLLNDARCEVFATPPKITEFVLGRGRIAKNAAESLNYQDLEVFTRYILNYLLSTSLLVTKMEKAAEAQGVEAKIFALSASEADPEIEKGEIDVILLGPQVRFMLKQFEEKAASINVPVEIINMQDYGMMNGEKVFATALKLIEEGA